MNQKCPQNIINELFLPLQKKVGMKKRRVEENENEKEEPSLYLSHTQTHTMKISRKKSQLKFIKCWVVIESLLKKSLNWFNHYPKSLQPGNGEIMTGTPNPPYLEKNLKKKKNLKTQSSIKMSNLHLLVIFFYWIEKRKKMNNFVNNLIPAQLSS